MISVWKGCHSRLCQRKRHCLIKCLYYSSLLKVVKLAFRLIAFTWICQSRLFCEYLGNSPTCLQVSVSLARHAGKTCWAQTAWILECIHSCFTLLKLSGMSCLAYVRKNSSILQTHTSASIAICLFKSHAHKELIFV